MEILEFMQTTAAVSGLVCLTISVLYAKKQLKEYVKR